MTTYASITGWGKCMPPAVLSNADLASFLDTDDEWIVTRTGMRERRISHVPASELATVASARALACAGLAATDLDLIVLGSCTFDEQVPNAASAVQLRLGATRAAAMDVNTACTSFLYALTTATSMIRSGVVRNALVVGAEVISRFMDWRNRNVAVLFGDGAAAVVLQSSQVKEGLIGESLGCYADARQILRVRGAGAAYTNAGVTYGDVLWDFDGPAIFKRAVQGMTGACETVLAKTGTRIGEVSLIVPHQANRRIIEAVVKQSGASMDRTHVTVERYANMSAATVPVALVDALEAGRVKMNSLLLMPGFGGGLSWCAHLVRWGCRLHPLDEARIELPPLDRSALDIVNELRATKGDGERSAGGLQGALFVDGDARAPLRKADVIPLRP